MTLYEILPKFKKYFTIQELVSEQVYKRYGDSAWQFFDIRLLEVLLWLREGMNIPLTCNSWSNKSATKKYQTRGFRANLDEEVLQKTNQNKLYCSAHSRGQGVDLSNAKITAKDIRKWIRANIDTCPHPIRLENDASAPTWVHIDVSNTSDKKLVEFSA